VRIAILEDDPDQLALLRRWIAEDGHDVHAYLSGREAMKQAGRESFDLFMLDWQVPDVSGAEVLMWLRANVSKTVTNSIGRLLSRGHLQETVWGRTGDLATRTVDTHVSQVRKKLDLRPESGYRVVPIYNYGYRLEKISPAP